MARKKKISPKAARRHLREIKDPNKHFYTRDNKALKNLIELYDYIRSCEQEDFRHHVDGSKNDFANWVRHVIMDEELAQQIDRCLLREPIQFRLLRRINILVSASVQELPEREMAVMILEEAVVPEEFFITADGRVLRNLWELHSFLKEAHPEVFDYHVNYRKNDIAEWVGDIVSDVELSDAIRRVRDKQAMAILVGLRLARLQRLARQRRGLTEEQQPYLIRVIRAVNPKLSTSP